MKQFKLSNKLLFLLAGLGLAIVTLAPSIYFYSKYRQVQNQTKNNVATSRQEIKDLVKQIGELMVLPEGEEPTIATVTDATKLAAQPFFANAVKGDKVLIFTQAKKVILYRPEINKIIEVAPVTIDQNTTPTPSPSPSPRAKK